MRMTDKRFVIIGICLGLAAVVGVFLAIGGFQLNSNYQVACAVQKSDGTTTFERGCHVDEYTGNLLCLGATYSPTGWDSFRCERLEVPR